MKKSLLKWTLIMAAFSGWTTTALAAGLTVTPGTITNDYVGKITLLITGLTPGQAVVVEKYGDFNTNGVIDAGEPVLQGGLVIDGSLPTIGGVRNVNVPGDEDGATNGQVRMELHYPGAEKGLDFFAAKYLIKVSDPFSGFALVTRSFEVKQKIFPQGVNGRLTSSGAGTPLANAMVVVLLPPHSDPVTGAMTDANGNYTLFGPPGDYTVFPLVPGFVGDFNGGATVSASAFATVNLALSAATRTISGKLKDSSNGIGLPGVFIQAKSDSGQFVSAFSRSDGTYSLGVLAGSWDVEPSSGALAQLGYLGWNNKTNVNTTSGNVANFDLPVDQATALVYGTVKDTQNNPVIGIGIWSNDQSQQYDASGTTLPPNADYCVGVRPGSWWVGPDDDALIALGYTGRGTNVTVAANQALRVDFKLRQVNATLPTIYSPALLSNGRLQFMLTDAAGQYYTIEYSTNLSDWATLLITNVSGGASLYLTFPTTNRYGFYRARGNTGFDGTYTGSWTLTCPACGDKFSAGTFTTTLVNGEFTNTSLPVTNGNSGILFSSGTVSPSGVITGTGVAPIQCPESVSSFTGQITLTPGGATMTITHSRLASPGGCAAEFGTITATRP